MNKIYLIVTATQCRYTSAHILNRCTCVTAATELEAATVALTDQPEQTYIFWLEVCQPQIHLFTLDQAMFVQQLFNVWQDLAAEATGRDTEWSYPILVDRLAQALHLTPKILVVLLANLTQPELEVGLNDTLTFHQPPIQGYTPAVIQEFYRIQVSGLARLKPSENCLSQKCSLAQIH
ncbi:hypothetical protein IFO70_34770 [Phormidium tenue FACHB-886]|nr:hypothetical protein [Phormidium tenue FACHB-886]